MARKQQYNQRGSYQSNSNRVTRGAVPQRNHNSRNNVTATPQTKQPHYEAGIMTPKSFEAGMFEIGSNACDTMWNHQKSFFYRHYNHLYREYSRMKNAYVREKAQAEAMKERYEELVDGQKQLQQRLDKWVDRVFTQAEAVQEAQKIALETSHLKRLQESKLNMPESVAIIETTNVPHIGKLTSVAVPTDWQQTKQVTFCLFFFFSFCLVIGRFCCIT